jgi:HEAT repeat protein
MNRKSVKRELMAPKHSRFPGWWPATTCGRVLLGLGFCLGALLVTVAIIVGSGWVENRFPSGDTKRTLLPHPQRLVTKPIVNTPSQPIKRAARSQAEAASMNTALTLEETIARFLDEQTPLAERAVHGGRLARDGSPAALAALLKFFRSASPEQQAFMVQLMGSSGHPTAKAWLWPLLDDKNERLVLAAVRGLSAIGGEEVVARLAEILADRQRAEPIRIEAALGLGTIGTPEGRDMLVKVFNQTTSSELAAQILNSLGRFEFPTVADTFAQYLATPETPREMRVAAAEALAHSSNEAVPFLLGLARADADADVRASAAWAISAHGPVADAAPALTEMVEREPGAAVRRRLYEALLPQAEIPANRLLPLVRAEQDIAARVAGFNVVGSAVHQEPASTIATTFDNEMVPELQRIATTPNSLNIQMRAVFALRRAQTPAAQAALVAIADSPRAQVATAARNGFLAARQSTQ